MKAITICQPFAELIIRGVKPVENRVWRTDYRGPLLIHAGKSRDWLTLDSTQSVDVDYGIPIDAMAFGAVIGIATLTYCHSTSYLRGRGCDDALRYLRDNPHTEGPYCFVLENPRRFSSPIPCRGMQGLFDVPELTRRIVEDELRKLSEARMPANVAS